MRWLYSAQSDIDTKQTDRRLNASLPARIRHIGTVTGFAIWATGELRVTATLSGVNVFDSLPIIVDGAALIACDVDADEWQVTPIGDSIIYSHLYAGTLVTTQSPSYPYALELGYASKDSRGVYGLPSSSIHNVLLEGDWIWRYINASEMPTWDAFRADTKGGRIPHVVEVPFSDVPVIVTSTTKKPPFKRVKGGAYWSGGFPVYQLP